jgi:bifunctional DNase/RNase
MARRVGALLFGLLLVACGGDRRPAEVEVPVRVGSLALDASHTPVVILEEENGSRVLPIWIGTAEAHSIASQIQQRRSRRPNFHDLAKQLIQQLDAEVVRVVVTDLRQGTFYALLTLRTSERTVEIDVRPSDGIAVALRTSAPILVRASVFDRAGETLDEEEPEGEPISWRGTRPEGALRGDGRQLATSLRNL